ncbi:MAG TPA: phosphate/phosphite/phosphonate ABC transporter substrate-binding protein [Chloroflexota bacterium]|nr:phosphate/phosphite/phosphonate ABC transporter substrate-binding protein [Chloroflexota bacterium]
MPLSRRSFLKRAAAIAAVASYPIASPAFAAPRPERPSTLRIGVVPNVAPEQQRALYKPFGDYIGDFLSMPAELFVATDYTGVVEALASDRLDMAYFGGLTYAQAEQRAQLYPIVTEVDVETSTPLYYSALITRADSPIQSVADIAGKKFAFGDINSTSGSLYPRVMLDRAGIGNFTDPNLFVYTGGHDATTLAVVNGSVDAGGVEKRIMQRLIDAGRVDGGDIRIIDQALVQGYPWCVRAALDPDLIESITVGFESISNPDLLQLMRAESYARVTSADYDEVRSEARRLGLVR